MGFKPEILRLPNRLIAAVLATGTLAISPETVLATPSERPGITHEITSPISDPEMISQAEADALPDAVIKGLPPNKTVVMEQADGTEVEIPNNWCAVPPYQRSPEQTAESRRLASSTNQDFRAALKNPTNRNVKSGLGTYASFILNRDVKLNKQRVKTPYRASKTGNIRHQILLSPKLVKEIRQKAQNQTTFCYDWSSATDPDGIIRDFSRAVRLTTLGDHTVRAIGFDQSTDFGIFRPKTPSHPRLNPGQKRN